MLSCCVSRDEKSLRIYLLFLQKFVLITKGIFEKVYNSKSNIYRLLFQFPLNDTHFMLTVHWAGEGSDVVVCLARNPTQSADASSSVFVSYDYGRSFVRKV